MKSKAKVTVASNANNLRIYFDGTPHLFVRRAQIVGFQSWRLGKGANPFKIEFYTKLGEAILCEYDQEDKWKAVLARLDKAVQGWR